VRGLGTDQKMLQRICAEDQIALNAIDGAVLAKDGNPTGANQYLSGTVDNVHSSTHRPSGNDRQRALRKLRKDSPTLHAEVLAGKLSPHAAK
jgi:hypothetical protein